MSYILLIVRRLRRNGGGGSGEELSPYALVYNGEPVTYNGEQIIVSPGTY